MKRKTLKPNIVVILFLAVILSWTSNSTSQTIITTEVLEPIWSGPDTILPISGTDITSSAEATNNIISEVSGQLPDSVLLSDISNRMKILKADVDTIEIEFAEFEREEFKSKSVLYLSKELSLINTEKESLNATLEKTSDDLIVAFDKINFLYLAWDISLESARSQDFSPTLIERSAQMLEESMQLRDRITKFEENIIHFSNELLTLKTRIDNLNSKLEEQELHYEMIYLSKTHPAIWQKDSVAGDTSMSFTHIASEIGDTYSTELGNFYQAYKVHLWIGFFLFIIFLFISLVIKRNIRLGRVRSSDSRIQTLFRIFDRPVSISLVLILFLFLALYNDASVVPRDVGSFLIVIPLVIISLLVLSRFWHPLLIITSLLFYFEEILETLRYESFPLPRYILLVATLLTTSYVIWLIIKRTQTRRKTSAFRLSIGDIALWLSLFVLLLAIATNVSGYVAMSFFLFRGMVISLMAAILIYVTVTIIESFFTLIIMGKSGQMLEVVREYGNKLVDRIIAVIKFFAVIYWIMIVLRRFLIYDAVVDWLYDILGTKWVVNEITISLEGILLFGLILFLAFWISRFIRLLLEKEIYTRVKFSRGIPGIISLLIRVGIITIGFILSLAVLGINLDKLTIILGALGVGIGFGLQDIINNLISGFILVFERPIQVGDTVKFGEREGIVKEIGIRASTIKTYDGTEVIVPNGKLVSNELVNLTLSDQMVRIEVDIKAEYGTDPQSVIDILNMQAKLHDDILDNPEPFAIFFGYGEYALSFRLYTYTTQVNSRLRIRSELNLAITEAFKQAVIKVPVPKQDINVKFENGKPKADK